MSLAQVQLAVAVTTLLIVSWMALTLATALAFPLHSLRASNALEQTPKKTFFVGVLMTILLMISFALFGAPNPLLKIIAWVGTLGIGSWLCIGAGGLARLFGHRIGEMAGAKTSFGELVRGSLVLSVAMAFPYFGWFLFAPVTLISALGAGTLSVLRKTSIISVSKAVTLTEG
ncbi:MAG: hypothetical protein H7308_09215 [Chthonomonadaceae bacterium]|nr:hypothetical protein [Chthonomonadaceae bacterium]